eukprot:911106-Rhodomonas_salina.2
MDCYLDLGDQCYLPTLRHQTTGNDKSFGGTRSWNLRRPRKQLSRKRKAPRTSDARSKRSKPFLSARQTGSVGTKRLTLDRGEDKRRTIEAQTPYCCEGCEGRSHVEAVQTGVRC